MFPVNPEVERWRKELIFWRAVGRRILTGLQLDERIGGISPREMLTASLELEDLDEET